MATPSRSKWRCEHRPTTHTLDRADRLWKLGCRNGHQILNVDYLAINDSTAADGVPCQGLPETETRFDGAVVRRQSQRIPLDESNQRVI